jgi:hypothetical protein
MTYRKQLLARARPLGALQQSFLGSGALPLSAFPTRASMKIILAFNSLFAGTSILVSSHVIIIYSRIEVFGSHRLSSKRLWYIATYSKIPKVMVSEELLQHMKWIAWTASVFGIE